MQTNTVINISIGLAIILVVYLIARRLGLAKSAADRKNAKNIGKVSAEIETRILTNNNRFQTSDFFRPETYKSSSKKNLLSDKEVQDYAERLDEALGWSIFPPRAGDDEDSIYAVFQDLENKMQISQLAEKMLYYDVDLRNRLMSALDEDEIDSLMIIINSKPDE